MRRRSFISLLGAALSAPLLPTRLASFGISPKLYAEAKYLSSTWVHTTPGMMRFAFNIEPDKAQHLFDLLIENRVLGVPNHFGVAKAAVPYWELPTYQNKLAGVVKSRQAARMMSKKGSSDPKGGAWRDKLKHLFEEDDDNRASPPANTDENTKHSAARNSPEAADAPSNPDASKKA